MARHRSWTDDALIKALQGATSWSGVCRRLGLRNGGNTIRLLRQRSQVLGLDIRGLPGPGAAARSWTDADLADAVLVASNLNEVFTLLGLSVGGGVWRRMQDHIVRLGVDTSHWRQGGVQPGHGVRRRRIQIDDEQLRGAVLGARSTAQVVRRLGLDATNGTAHRRVRERMRDLGLDGELLGQAWARGRRRPARARVPLEQILVRGSAYRGGTAKLRERLIEEGILHRRCAGCGIGEWRGRPAPLQLDHIDGDPRNNELGNLRVLCANCHAQTPTYCGRNIGRR